MSTSAEKTRARVKAPGPVSTSETSSCLGGSLPPPGHPRPPRGVGPVRSAPRSKPRSHHGPVPVSGGRGGRRLQRALREGGSSADRQPQRKSDLASPPLKTPPSPTACPPAPPHSPPPSAAAAPAAQGSAPSSQPLATSWSPLASWRRRTPFPKPRPLV